MSLVVHFGRRVFGILQWFVASIRRLFCCWRKRIYESDLPFLASSHSNKTNGADGAFLENWDAWDGTKSKPKSLIQTQIEEYRHRLSSELKAPPTDVEPDIEPDIFIDMEPEYKKTKRILLKPKTNTPQNAANKFAMQTDVALVDSFNTRELGVLDDYEDQGGVNWDVEESLDVDSVLKEAKMKERLERVEKHKQKKYEKVQQSFAKGKPLDAVKLS